VGLSKNSPSLKAIVISMARIVLVFSQYMATSKNMMGVCRDQ
jgi:hypothetical protein